MSNTAYYEQLKELMKDMSKKIILPSGSGLPDGGTEGQVLTKKSDADGDIAWKDSGGVDSIPVMVGASNYADGAKGLVPKPSTTDTAKFLCGDGTWKNIYSAASGSTVIILGDSSFYGQTVTMMDSHSSLAAIMGDNGEAVFTDVQMAGGVTVTATDTAGQIGRAQLNMTYFGTYIQPLSTNYATLSVTNSDSKLIGQTIEVYFNGKKITEAGFDLAGNSKIYVEKLGTYLLKTNGTEIHGQKHITVAEMGTIIDVDLFAYHVYAYKIDETDSNPFTCVTAYASDYGCDNIDYTPAHMDYENDVFDYGSWTGEEFFFPKPCMLKYNGDVAYYLNKNDYTKKVDGTNSDVADMSYDGNVMIEFPTVYFKRWQANDKTYVVISDKRLDSGFHAYAHHDINDQVLPYIYISAYDGSSDGTRLRSISGISAQTVGAYETNRIMAFKTVQEGVDFAKANNSNIAPGHEGWYIWHKAEWDMVIDLLVLLGMSTDTQTVFGRGRDTGYVSITQTGQVATGSMNTKGLFWGENAGAAGVKVFGIENFWANVWKAVAGWINSNGTQKVKMSYKTADGSTVSGFNFTGSGYVSISGATPSEGYGAYVTRWKKAEQGYIPYVANGTASTYIPDGLWANNGYVSYALVGGSSFDGLPCGAFCSNLVDAASVAYWNRGAALSYK